MSNGDQSPRTPHTRYRAKPVVINAIRWTGGDYECLNDFCGKNWTRADAVDMGYDDKEQVVLWNTKARQYLHCPVGHWIIRGVAGELYPCAPDVFAKKYEQDNACQECNGTGRKLFKLDLGTARVEDCKTCNATGYIDQTPRCPKCGHEYDAAVSETSTPLNEGPILSDSINTWFATDQGDTCLSGVATGKYLKNRLEAAFIAGWDARKKVTT